MPSIYIYSSDGRKFEISPQSASLSNLLKEATTMWGRTYNPPDPPREEADEQESESTRRRRIEEDEVTPDRLDEETCSSIMVSSAASEMFINNYNNNYNNNNNNIRHSHSPRPQDEEEEGGYNNNNNNNNNNNDGGETLSAVRRMVSVNKDEDGYPFSEENNNNNNNNNTEESAGTPLAGREVGNVEQEDGSSENKVNGFGTPKIEKKNGAAAGQSPDSTPDALPAASNGNESDDATESDLDVGEEEEGEGGEPSSQTNLPGPRAVDGGGGGGDSDSDRTASVVGDISSRSHSNSSSVGSGSGGNPPLNASPSSLTPIRGGAESLAAADIMNMARHSPPPNPMPLEMDSGSQTPSTLDEEEDGVSVVDSLLCNPDEGDDEGGGHTKESIKRGGSQRQHTEEEEKEGMLYSPSHSNSGSGGPLRSVIKRNSGTLVVVALGEQVDSDSDSDSEDNIVGGVVEGGVGSPVVGTAADGNPESRTGTDPNDGQDLLPLTSPTENDGEENGMGWLSPGNLHHQRTPILLDAEDDENFHIISGDGTSKTIKTPRGSSTDRSDGLHSPAPLPSFSSQPFASQTSNGSNSRGGSLNNNKQSNTNNNLNRYQSESLSIPNSDNQSNRSASHTVPNDGNGEETNQQLLSLRNQRSGSVVHYEGVSITEQEIVLKLGSCYNKDDDDLEEKEASPSSSEPNSKHHTATHQDPSTAVDPEEDEVLESSIIELCITYLNHFAEVSSFPPMNHPHNGGSGGASPSSMEDSIRKEDPSSPWEKASHRNIQPEEEAPTVLPTPLTKPLTSLLSAWEVDFLYQSVLQLPESAVESAKRVSEVFPDFSYPFPSNQLLSEEVHRRQLMISPAPSREGMKNLLHVLKAATRLQITSLRELCLACLGDWMIRSAYGAADNFEAAHLIRQVFHIQGDWSRKETDCLKVENEWPANEEE